ncbi:hypothetical protein Tco_1000394, partial [Tanacetum coccineum]
CNEALAIPGQTATGKEFSNPLMAGKSYYCWAPKLQLLSKFLSLEALLEGRDTKIPQSSGPPVKVGNDVVHKELGDRMERVATTASSLEAEQDSGSGPRCQDTILGDVDAQTRFETTSKQSNDPPLSKVNIFRSGENNMQLMELMTHYTKLIERYYEQSTKIDDSTASEAITTADVEDSAVPTIPKIVEETLAQTLMEIKAAKPKAKGIVFHDLEKQVSKPTVSVTQPSIKDKGKGIMQEPERPLTKKVQVALDEDLARNIQAQLDAEIFEEERLERQKQEEANIALIESWENT